MPAPLSRRRFLAVAAGVATTAATGVVAALRRAESPGARTAATRPATRTTPTSPPTAPSTAAPTTSAPTAAAPGQAPTTTTAPAPPPRVEMLCREAWEAAPPAGELPPHTVGRITVHHTGVMLTDNREAPARMRGHQRHHQRNGFTDIAYHVVIDGRGHVYEGRSPDQPGETFTDYDPTGHLLVTLEGNFDEQGLPEAQLRSLAGVLAWATRRFGVPQEEILGHRDVASTSCPGAAVYAAMADGTLGRLVGEALAAGTEVVESCGPRAAATVAAIRNGAA